MRASLEATFDSIVSHIGRLNETPDGKPFPMVLEAVARWPLVPRSWREQRSSLGTRAGIKRPTLLEIYGPLFMSYPAMSNVQYRLKEIDGGTLIAFSTLAFGFISDDHRKGVGTGLEVDPGANPADAERQKTSEGA